MIGFQVIPQQERPLGIGGKKCDVLADQARQVRAQTFQGEKPHCHGGTVTVALRLRL